MISFKMYDEFLYYHSYINVFREHWSQNVKYQSQT